MAISTSNNDVDNLISLVDVNIESVNNGLDELQQRYENQLKLQDKLMNEQNKMLDDQDKMLDELQVKLVALEEHVVFPSHIYALGGRLLDDNDQMSRRLNLRIEGIVSLKNDSPEEIMNYIKSEVKRLNLDIADNKFDSAHRVGLKYFNDGEVHQSVVLKMLCALARRKIFINRKNFKFQLYVDLTRSRETTLNFAKYELKNGLNLVATRVVDSVYAELNGTLYLKSNFGERFGFSSEAEFLSLVSWLDKEF